jgi:hypothetical protein
MVTSQRFSFARVRRVGVVVGTLGAGSLFVACGSNSPGASAPSAVSSQAQSELLAPSAYPQGWKGQGPASKNSHASFFGAMTAALLNEVTTCLAMTTKNVDTHPAEAAAQQYDDPNSTVTVTESVDVFPTVAQASVDAGAAANSHAPSCIAQFLVAKFAAQTARNLGPAGKLGTLSATRRAVEKFGDRDSDIVLSFPYSLQGSKATAYLENVTVQVGRSESNFQFENSGGPVPTAIVNSLLRAAVEQMR